MVCNNESLTVQQFKRNALSPEFLGIVSSLKLLEDLSLLREYLIVFSMIFKLWSIDKFIKFKGCARVSLILFIALMVSPTAN